MNLASCNFACFSKNLANFYSNSIDCATPSGPDKKYSSKIDFGLNPKMTRFGFGLNPKLSKIGFGLNLKLSKWLKWAYSQFGLLDTFLQSGLWIISPNGLYNDIAQKR